MLSRQVMKHFRIERPWNQAGYFETERLTQFREDVMAAIMAGHLIAISGPVGVGKTVMINRLQEQITADKKIIVARSLSVDKPRVVLPALITALFLDISGDPDMKVPTQPERRERLLQEAVRKAKKPIALFIDEAHDLHGNTLNGLKRLREVIGAGGGTLSVVLVGHPRLRNDLRRATMEEVGHRTVKFEFSSIGDERREFVSWLLGQCLAERVEPLDVFEDAAQQYLAERLSTPLQFAEHLNRAFADAYRMGADQVTREIVEETISVGFDDLDARLARIGYSPKALADLTDTRLPEIRRFLKGQLDTDRTDELSTLMRKAGLPI
ncbi:Type II secretory pathway, component ExeA (predicted ATPase) [Salipiger thiooxidans]|jgi:type II secretory pathway predicted ATPase ExeA|nr:ATPase AAA [Actibacterium sp. EMB200-NS6]SDF70423.1 Type II secretory pathway, component ExeA (predicted ATPase) [Salipiger thiooxidans]